MIQLITTSKVAQRKMEDYVEEVTLLVTMRSSRAMSASELENVKTLAIGAWFVLYAEEMATEKSADGTPHGRHLAHELRGLLKSFEGKVPVSVTASRYPLMVAAAIREIIEAIWKSEEEAEGPRLLDNLTDIDEDGEE